MKLIVLLLLAFPLCTVAQSDSAIIYDGVVSVEGAAKAELFSRARTWFNTSFKDMKSVVTISDKEEGHISGNGIISSVWHYRQFGKTEPYPAKVDALISIWVKDGRYKYEVRNLYARNIIPNSAASKDFGALTSSVISPVKWQGVRQKVMDEIWLDLKSETESRIKSMITSLYKSMSSKTLSNDF